MMLFKPTKSYLLTAISRVKKSEPEKEFGIEKWEYPKSVATFPMKNEDNSTSMPTFSPYKKSGTFGAKDVECY